MEQDIRHDDFKHQFVAPFHDSLGLSVYNCGFQKCAPLYSWGPALRSHDLIHFVAKGKGKFVCLDKEYTVSAGDGFFAPANKVIFYEADENEPWEYYWVGFSGVDAPRLLDACRLSAEKPCFHSSDPDEMIRLILDIYGSNGVSAASEAHMTGGLYSFLAKIIEENAPEESAHRTTKYLDSAVKYIEHNFSLPITVTDIANSAAISRSHLYRIFMQELQITPNDYLVKYRISVACNLLRNAGISVSEAAYSSGFSDPLYFSRVFKRIKGCTPSAYARSVQQEQ